MRSFELDHLIDWLSSMASAETYRDYYGENEGPHKQREDAAYFRAVRETLAGMEYVGFLQNFRNWYRSQYKNKPEIRYDYSSL